MPVVQAEDPPAVKLSEKAPVVELAGTESANTTWLDGLDTWMKTWVPDAGAGVAVPEMETALVELIVEVTLIVLAAKATGDTTRAAAMRAVKTAVVVFKVDAPRLR